MMKPAWFLLPIVVVGVAGCSGSQEATMSAQDRANFAGGGPTSVRSPQQQSAMNNFIADFNKKHPPHGGGPDGPPTGTPPK